MPPFNEFSHAVEPLAQTLSSLTSNMVTLPSSVFTVTNGSTVFEVKSDRIKHTGNLEITGSLTAPSGGLVVSGIRGIAHNIGAGLMHFNTGTGEISYSTN